MGTIVPCQMFTLHRFRYGLLSQVDLQISVPKMGIVAILRTNVRPWGGNPSPSPAM